MQLMKNANKTAIMVSILVLAGLSNALAAAQLRLSDGTPGGTVTIDDQGPGDTSTDLGTVTYNGAVGSSWFINITTGTTKPAQGDALVPYMDLGTINLSSVANSALTIEFTESGFLTAGVVTANIGGTTDGNVTFTTYSDAGNANFAKTTLLTSQGPFPGPNFDGTANGVIGPVTPYSLTIETVINHPLPGVSNTGFDAELFVTPNCPPPTIQCPPDQNLGCNPSTIPACDVALVTVTGNNPTVTCASFDGSDGCTRYRTNVYTVVDACNNTTTCRQVLTWTVDNDPPVFTGCPTGPIVLPCNSAPTCATVASLGITASDNCSGSITPECSPGPVLQTRACGGRIQTFTLTAMDACQKSSTCTVTYTWTEDTTKPTITTCPTGANLGCNPTTIPTCDTVKAGVVASDNCHVKQLNCEQSDSDNGCTHTRIFTIRAEDDCGNLSDPCVVTYTWTVDTTKPTITCPTDKTINCTASTLPANTGTATASDNCGGIKSITYTDVDLPGSCGDHVIKRTWTAEDNCGKKNTCTQTITVTGCAPCVTSTFDFSGNTALDGTDGNIRTFTAPSGVQVKVSAFSRPKAGGNFKTAYVGSYSGGLGVTDSISDGTGANNTHTVDNSGEDNFLLFEFSAPVVVDKVFLGYVVGDSDLNAWIGTFTNPFNNHVTPSATLTGFGPAEANTTTLTTTRTADLNSGQVMGNVLLVAAKLGETGDRFKLEKLYFCGPATVQPCPSPWNTKDIGACGAVGSAGYLSGTFTVVGSGADIWNTADEFRSVYQLASGDCLIAARVVSVQNSDPWAKVGVMIRKTLDPGSEHASLFLTPGNGVAFQSRGTANGASLNVNTIGPAASYWVAVVRSGDTFSGYASPNGSDWTLIGSQTIPMGSSVYIGLGVTSHNDGVLCTGKFDNVFASP